MAKKGNSIFRAVSKIEFIPHEKLQKISSKNRRKILINLIYNRKK